MLDERHFDDPMRCPSCFYDLPEDAIICSRCELSLYAPQLKTVWEKSQQIRRLLDERASLIQDAHVYTAALSSRPGQAPPGAKPSPAHDPANPIAPLAGEATEEDEDEDAPGESVPADPGDVAAEHAAFSDPEVASSAEKAVGSQPTGVNRPDVGPLSVRSALLALGVGLLIVAAVIFIVVAWGRMGIAARAVILWGLTAGSGFLAGLARTRALAATAEALTGLTVALLLLDAYAFRRAGLFQGLLDGDVYWALITGLLAGAAAVAARYVRVVPRLITAVLAQFPVPLLADRIDSASVLAVALGAQALVLVQVEARWGREVRPVGDRVSAALRVIAGVGAALAFLVAVLQALGVAVGIFGSWRIAGSVVLLLLAFVPWTLAWLHGGRRSVRTAGTATATGLVLTALATAVRTLGVPLPWVAPTLAALCLAVVLGALRLPRGTRSGPLGAAALFAGSAFLTQLLYLLALLGAPFAQLTRPWGAGWFDPAWSLVTAGRQAPQQPDQVLADGPDALPALLTTLIVALVFAALARGLRPPAPDDPDAPSAEGLIDVRYAGVVADVLLAAGAVAAPVGLPLPHVLSVLLQLAAATVLLLRPAAVTRRLSTPGRLAAGLGAAVLLLAVCWSLAAQGSTLTALLGAAVLLGFGAVRSPEPERPFFAGMAVVAVCAEAMAVGFAFGAGLSAAATMSALVAALLAGAAVLFGPSIRSGAETGAALSYAVSLALVGSLAMAGWVALAGAGAAAVVALRRDRRSAAAVSGGLSCLAAACLAAAAGLGGFLVATIVCVTAAVVVLVGSYVLLGRDPEPDSGEQAPVPPTDSVGPPPDPDTAAARSTEAVGTFVYAVAVLTRVPAGDLLHLSVLLTIGGVTAAVVALRSRRRQAWKVALTLLTAASWARLAAAEIGEVEAYTVPPALALLAVGVVRRRRQPGTSSWEAYAGGLLLALVPSLLAALFGGSGIRALVLGVGALAATLVGARYRLQAPLAIGGTVLLVDAIFQVAPYAAVLPRWVSVAAAGLLLLALGVTYDRRLRDVRRLRERFGQMG